MTEAGIVAKGRQKLKNHKSTEEFPVYVKFVELVSNVKKALIESNLSESHVCPCEITNLSHWPQENRILHPTLFCEYFVAFGAGKWLLSCLDPFMSVHE